MPLLTGLAQAHVNVGRWIAECPREDCTNAIALKPRQTQFFCEQEGGCLLLAEVEWPPNADEIWAALAARPVPRTRNWAPAGHRQSIACGFPEGQSVADLIAENREHGVS